MKALGKRCPHCNKVMGLSVSERWERYKELNPDWRKRISRNSKRYRKTKAGKRQVKNSNLRHKAYRHSWAKKHIDAISTQYVRSVLRVPKEIELPRNIVEAKRTQIQLHRLIKQRG